MTKEILILRSTTPGNRPAGHAYGSPYINFADNQFGVVNAGGAPVDLILPNKYNFTFRNRACNGAIVFDQANEGVALHTPNGSAWGPDGFYAVGNVATSRFSIQQIAAPAGLAQFPNALQLKSLTAFTPVAANVFYSGQNFEYGSWSDLQWGTASAQPIVVSFWAQSSLTGQFSFAVSNGISPYWVYITQFTIAVANAWQKVALQIPGCPSGSWTPATANGVAGGIWWDLGSGANAQLASGSASQWVQSNTGLTIAGSVGLVHTNGATLTIAGLQVEAGVTPTPFEYLPRAVELARLQRYYEKSLDIGVAPGTGSAAGYSQYYLQPIPSTTSASIATVVPFRVSKRADPAMTAYSLQSGAAGTVFDGQNNVDVAALAGNWAAGMASAVLSVLAAAPAAAVNLMWHWTADARI